MMSYTWDLALDANLSTIPIMSQNIPVFLGESTNLVSLPIMVGQQEVSPKEEEKRKLRNAYETYRQPRGKEHSWIKYNLTDRQPRIN